MTTPVSAILLAIVAWSILLITPAVAHDHNNPALDQWYGGLQSEGGGACCDQREAESVEWKSEHGHYKVMVEGDWLAVPDDRIVKGANISGRGALVWLYYFNGMPFVRCFLPGEGI